MMNNEFRVWGVKENKYLKGGRINDLFEDEE
jgi:hypothetical protein